MKEQQEQTSSQTVSKSDGAMCLKQVADRVNLVHSVLQKVMKNGTHYGIVPGCGNKKVLLKPGADVLAMTFQLVPQFSVERNDLDNGHREYSVVCSMYSSSGLLLGQGVGFCSTMEKKYRYRKYGDDKVDNEDIADVYNTVLKMAKKRAHVDATLTVTGAGDLFTQDMIDEDEGAYKQEPIKRATMKQPQQQAVESANSFVGVIEDVKEIHSKADAPKPWTKWGVVCGGETYGTFDKTLGDAATVLKGCEAVIEWREDGKYKVLTGIKPHESSVQDDAIPPAHHLSGKAFHLSGRRSQTSPPGYRACRCGARCQLLSL